MQVTWGILKMPSNNPIETLFNSFCKQLLGTQKQSVNDGVLLELGQFPISIHAKKRSIKNWVRMATNTNCNNIVYESYQYCLEEKLIWTENMKSTLSEIGLMQSWMNKEPDTHIKAFKRLQDIFHQVTLENIKQENNKLRTYALFKTMPRFEKYLDELKCIKERTALTKLRLSNHNLMIEKGRHSNINKELRFCPFCPNKIENEKHFLMECQTYKHLRIKLYRDIENIFPSIHDQPYDQKFLNLMRDVSTASVSRFTAKAMELRTFLLENYRNQN